MQEKMFVSTPRHLDIHPVDVSKSSSVVSLSNEHLCRICHESGKKELFSHCRCKGSVGLSHTSCLLHWIKQSGSLKCELCKQKYVTIAQINKRFWQWKLPRIGTKGWFKFTFFIGFLSMLVAFTTWIIWSRTSSTREAKEERKKRQIEYTYIVYGMLILIAIVGMYALNFRPFLRFVSKCIVINQRITVVPNGELCKEELASKEHQLSEFGGGKADESKKYCSCKHDFPELKDTYVQVQMEDTKYGVRGYTKLASGENMNML